MAALRQEDQELQQEQLEVIERLKVAREMGDLSENGAYKYAKFELGRIRHRLGEIHHLLKLGVVIQKPTDGAIGFGSVVTLQGPTGGRTFTLVSEHESDPIKGKLSDKSPIGAAVWGRQVGESITVALPAGETSFTILSIT